MGQWLRIMPQSLNNYFTHFTGKLNYWWQVVYVISAIFGSTLAVYCGNGDVLSLLYGEPFDNIKGNTMAKHLLFYSMTSLVLLWSTVVSGQMLGFLE